MKFVRTIGCAITVSAALLAGCSGALEGKKIDYKSAGKLPPLEIPPDLAAPGNNNRYSVPEATPGSAAVFSQYDQQRGNKPSAPVSSGVLPTFERVRVERGGTQRWLVVKATPEQIFPVVRDFWQENGFLIKTEDASIGLMETDWAENRAKLPIGGITGFINKQLDVLTSLPERDRFRTRLERGAEPGTTEVFVSHKGMAEVYYKERDNNTKWQVRPSDPELEALMLSKLALRFGVAAPADAVALVRNADKTPAQAAIVKSTTGTTVKLNDGFDRAWRRVGLALDRVGFMVEDRNRADGIYFVRYQDPDADAAKPSGILSKLAFWRSDDAGRKGPEQFRVRVSALGAGTEVKVLDKTGAVDNSDAGKRILALLAEQLQ